MTDNLSFKDVKVALFGKQYNKVKLTKTQEEIINKIINEDNFLIKDNFISYLDVLKGKATEGRLNQYYNAIRFVTYLTLGYSDSEAYRLTFPDRYRKIYETYYDEKTEKETQLFSRMLGNFAKAVKQSKMVQEILEIMIIPSYIANYGLVQEAINTQVHLMRNAKSELVRHQAASKLMDYLKPPEENKLQIDVNVKNDTVAKLEETLVELAEQQLKAIENGTEVKKIAEMDIIDVDTEN